MENNSHLNIWIPLDWAQALLLAKEIEEGVREAKEFFHRSPVLKSPHVLSRTFQHAEKLAAGYNDVLVVREFREELDEYARRQEKNLVMAAQEVNNSKE